jgi:hypothetical protein
VVISGYGFRRSQHRGTREPSDEVCAASRSGPRRATHRALRGVPRTASARPIRARASRAAFAGRSIALSRPAPSRLRQQQKSSRDGGRRDAAGAQPGIFCPTRRARRRAHGPRARARCGATASVGASAVSAGGATQCHSLASHHTRIFYRFAGTSDRDRPGRGARTSGVGWLGRGCSGPAANTGLGTCGVISSDAGRGVGISANSRDDG